MKLLGHTVGVVAQLDECEDAGCVRGGILTPATAMGPALLRRLTENGEVKFEISPKVGDSGTTDVVPSAETGSQQHSRM